MLTKCAISPSKCCSCPKHSLAKSRHENSFFSKGSGCRVKFVQVLIRDQQQSYLLLKIIVKKKKSNVSVLLHVSKAGL